MTYYPEPFIFWLIFGDHPFTESVEVTQTWTDELTDKKYTINDLYDEWLNTQL